MLYFDFRKSLCNWQFVCLDYLLSNMSFPRIGVAKDRIIDRFALAQYQESTPYKQYDFSPRVVQEAQSAAHAQQSRTVKAVVVGDIAVGKTCLVNRFCHDIFQQDYRATIGVDFEVEKFAVLSMPFTLHLWDTAGAERFKCIAASYYRGANVVIVVFDMSNVKSLESARQWKDEACANAQTDSQHQFVFLVGSKKDLLCGSAVAKAESDALQLASELNAEYWSLSSKTGENVKEFFFRVVSLSFDASLQRELVTVRGRTSKKTGVIDNDKRISVQRRTQEEEDSWKRMKSRMKCCSS